MATIPNRYYDSPWIGAAAQNLTEAMFGSPERELARVQGEKAQNEMYRQAHLDAQADEDRTRVTGAREGMVKQLEAMSTPGYVPNDSDYAKLASFSAQGDAKLGETMNLLAQNSPGYLQKMGLLNRREQGLDGRNDDSLAGALARALLAKEASEYGADRRYDSTVYSSNKGFEGRQYSADQVKAAADAKLKNGGGGKVYKVSPTDRFNLRIELGNRANAKGLKLDPDRMNAALVMAGQILHDTGDSAKAVEDAFRSVVPQGSAVQEEKEPTWGFGMFGGAGTGRMAPESFTSPAPAAAPAAVTDFSRSMGLQSGHDDFSTSMGLNPASYEEQQPTRSNQPIGGPPQRNAQGWELMSDGSGNLAYVSPDGRQYQEVR